MATTGTQLETPLTRNLETAQTHKETTPHNCISVSADKYGDWCDDFFREGYVVIEGAISKEKAQYYREKCLDWVSSFGLGLDIKDRTTWTADRMPYNVKGGMYPNFCVAHEKFVWDARLEPGVIEPFARVWGTDELVVSFDTINPHVDQSPERKGLSCVQGILNYSNARPDDGGLLLMKGSSVLFDEEIWKHFEPRRPDDCPVKHYDFFPYQDKHVRWFESKGCELIKVCAEPGDLILWDSRTMHYAEFPKSDTIRTIQYVCYALAAMAKPEDLKHKAEIFRKFEGTTRWPHCNIWSNGKHMIDGKLDALERLQPLELPEITDRMLQLAGAKPY